MTKLTCRWLAAALACAALAGCRAAEDVTEPAPVGGEAPGDGAPAGGDDPVDAAADADVETQADTDYTYHAIVTCQSAGLYGNYSPGDLRDKRYDVYYGNKIGVRKGAGDSYAAVVLDYGPNTWGFMQRDCLTRCWGPNDPIAGCF